jgi:hypothetical protein
MVGGEYRPVSSIPMVSSLKLTAPLSVGQAAQCRIKCKLYPGVTGTLAFPAAVDICEWLVLPYW